MGGEEKAEAGGFIEEVVATGSGGGNLTALETSYGVAILDADDIRKGSPDGLADLVDAVPGLQGELSQGETNTNLNVRGTQSGFNSLPYESIKSKTGRSKTG